MPAKVDIPNIVARVRNLLSEAESENVHLHLSGQRFEDDWLYLVVEPTKPGERASKHAHFMTRVERTLRDEGYDQVLLVPAVPEHSGLTDAPI
ncbi:MAG TPA: hypothetical protein VFC78_02630 [Tepidisphaeraceae bacterium]|nr:hypothetical protein [Tepidisphaeraceae bacterium]